MPWILGKGAGMSEKAIVSCSSIFMVCCLSSIYKILPLLFLEFLVLTSLYSANHLCILFESNMKNTISC